MIAVYKITNNKNQVYIGATMNYLGRLSHYMYNDTKGQELLKKSIEDNGFNNHTFEVLQKLPQNTTIIELRELEKLFIKSHYKEGVDMLNIKHTKSKVYTDEMIEVYRECKTKFIYDILTPSNEIIKGVKSLRLFAKQNNISDCSLGNTYKRRKKHKGFMIINKINFINTTQ